MKKEIADNDSDDRPQLIPSSHCCLFWLPTKPICQVSAVKGKGDVSTARVTRARLTPREIMLDESLKKEEATADPSPTVFIPTQLRARVCVYIQRARRSVPTSSFRIADAENNAAALHAIFSLNRNGISRFNNILLLLLLLLFLGFLSAGTKFIPIGVS
jgi:hypothetical protein